MPDMTMSERGRLGKAKMQAEIARSISRHALHRMIPPAQRLAFIKRRYRRLKDSGRAYAEYQMATLFARGTGDLV